MLDAAETVAVREGILRLTFDAVAAEAGVSKGGLLHYFSSKEHLIEAMVERSAEGWRACFMEAYHAVPEGPGRMVRGLLNHCFVDAESWTESLRRSHSAVLAALAQNPELVRPMQRVYDELYGHIMNDGLPEGVADTLVAAIDGVWFYWLLRLRPVDQGVLTRVRRTISIILSEALVHPERFAKNESQKESS